MTALPATTATDAASASRPVGNSTHGPGEPTVDPGASWSIHDPRYHGTAAPVTETHLSDGTPGATGSTQESAYAAAAQAPGSQNIGPSGTSRLEVFCGPLLNYKHMSNEQSETPIWHGSVLLVTTPGDTPPELRLEYAGPVRGTANGASPPFDGQGHGRGDGAASSNVTGFKLYSDSVKAFWRMDVQVPLRSEESSWQYHIPAAHPASGVEGKPSATKTFVVPSKHQSMRVMFHSCNGFSVGADVNLWSGPALWHDVLRLHRQRPFHVMIGGGDQIYNDSVRVNDGPLQPWTNIKNPVRRRDHPFGEDLRAKCDDFYYRNYVRWYSTEPFATANGQIPQINIWDDHDIIDGFGSYTDHLMRAHVFRGIGGVAHKYYMLFQHHAVPPPSTFASDSRQTMLGRQSIGMGPDETQLKEVFVRREPLQEPSFIVGQAPGPYIPEPSRNIFTRLGKGMAFLGIDARTERTRHQINYPGTYDLIFNRVDQEFTRAGGQVKHLLVLLGVPIAYPRLIWLENILKSPIIGPIRFLNKRFGIAGGFFNYFDGQVDILDDLDDHYTARQHKAERKMLILRLQEVARRHNVRITILSGDVHLGALGRFYSKPKLGIPVPHDHRYIVNVISSAITNQPPPPQVANMLWRRNKIHHLDHETDETLMNLFDKGPGGRQKAAPSNHCTMPSRNYAILTETSSAEDDQTSNGTALANGSATATNGTTPPRPQHHRTIPLHKSKDGHGPLHPGEEGAGTQHPAAAGIEVRHLPDEPYGLDIAFRVEIDRSDPEGHTEGYGFHIPGLVIPKA